MKYKSTATDKEMVFCQEITPKILTQQAVNGSVKKLEPKIDSSIKEKMSLRLTESLMYANKVAADRLYHSINTCYISKKNHLNMLILINVALLPTLMAIELFYTLALSLFILTICALIETLALDYGSWADHLKLARDSRSIINAEGIQKDSKLFSSLTHYDMKAIFDLVAVDIEPKPSSPLLQNYNVYYKVAKTLYFYNDTVKARFILFFGIPIVAVVELFLFV